MKRRKSDEKQSRFSSETLLLVERSLARRLRSMRSRTAKVAIERSLDDVDGNDTERFDLDIALGHPGECIRLSVWTDRYLVFNARHRLSNGRVADCKVFGRATAPDLNRLEPAVQATIALYAQRLEGHAFCTEVQRVWDSIAKDGPR